MNKTDRTNNRTNAITATRDNKTAMDKMGKTKILVLTKFGIKPFKKPSNDNNSNKMNNNLIRKVGNNKMKKGNKQMPNKTDSEQTNKANNRIINKIVKINLGNKANKIKHLISNKRNSSLHQALLL